MGIRHWAFGIGVMFFISGCQGAVTNRPEVSDSELEAEQRAQSDIAKQQAQRDSSAKVPITKESQARFDAISARIAKAGRELCADMKREKCDFSFVLEEDSILNAHADGSKIVVSSAMAGFADDDELAGVLGHEYAHNIMRHVATQTKNAMAGNLLGVLLDVAAGTQGVDTGGAFSQIGSQQAVMRYSVSFEEEADYVGLYVMRRAGFDITKAPNFWRKMSAAEPDGIYTQTSHPSNPARYVALNKTIEEIGRKEKAGAVLVPDLEKE